MGKLFAVGTGAGRPAWKPFPLPPPLEPRLCLEPRGRATGWAAAGGPPRRSCPLPASADGTQTGVTRAGLWVCKVMSSS